jgi:hypothetical protein
VDSEERMKRITAWYYIEDEENKKKSGEGERTPV